MAGATLALRAEAHVTLRWVRAAPLSLQVLNFGAGAACAVAGAAGVALQLLNFLHLSAVLLNAYLALAGLVVAGLEARSRLCSAGRLAGGVLRWCAFLGTAAGRGGLLVVLGLASLATVAGPFELLNLVAGALALAVGAYDLAIGWAAGRKLRALRCAQGGTAVSEARVRAVFATADPYGLGKVPPTELGALLARLEPPTLLSAAELRAAALALDTDHNGYIELEELVAWWCHGADCEGGDGVAGGGGGGGGAWPRRRAGGGEQQQQQQQQQQRDDAAAANNLTLNGSAIRSARDVHRAAQAGWHATTGRYRSLRAASLLVCLATAASGAVAIVATAALGSPVRVFVNALILALGLLGAALEGRAALCGTNLALALSRQCRLLSRVWGRGLVYVFASTLALCRVSLAEVTNVAVGWALFAVGVANVATGLAADRRLAALHGERLGHDRARAAFAEADADGNGTLDSAELAALLVALGLDLSRPQLEAALLEMDTDVDGCVSLREFVEWSQSSALSDEAWDAFAAGEEAAGSAGADGAPAAGSSYGSIQ